MNTTVSFEALGRSRKKYISLTISLVLVLSSALLMIPVARANYTPFQRTFIITAYYSPLPGQQYYVTGSLARDKRLNGNGTNGADGTPVYDGMIAAPSTYAFGTRINCPGIIDGEIHDRGGAIVKTGVRNNAYDRLDFWAGHGEEGLKRALYWGKRTLTCTMYAPGTSNVQQYANLPMGNLSLFAKRFLKRPQVSVAYIPPRYKKLLSDLGYDPDDEDERVAFQIRHGIISSAEDPAAGTVGPGTRSKLEAIVIAVEKRMPRQKLQEGDVDADVRILQEMLQELGYLGVAPTANFGPKTKAALIRYQLDKGLIETASHPAAGYLGPGTYAELKKAALQEFLISAEDRYQIALLKADEIRANAIARAEAFAKEQPNSEEVIEEIDLFTEMLSELGNEWIKEHTPTEENADPNSELLPAEARRAKEGLTPDSPADRDPGKRGKLVLASIQEEESYKEVKAKLSPILNPFIKRFQIGSVHPEIQKIQQLLKNAGFFEGEIITSYFGPQTKKAVVKFQLEYSIVDTLYSPGAGIVGPKTVKALNALHYGRTFSLPHEISSSVRAPAVHPDDLKVPEILQQASIESSTNS